MNFHQTMTMALKSIFNNKVRSFLTMLGVIIGVAAVITIVAILQGMKSKIMESYTMFGTNSVDVSFYSKNSNIADDLVNYSETELKNLILGITPSSQTNSTIRYRSKTKQNTPVYLGSTTFDLCNDLTVETGRTINTVDVKKKNKVCVIGSAVKQTFFGAMSPVGQKIKINGKTYTIIGVYKEKFGGKTSTPDDMILLPSSLSRELTGERYATQYKIKARDAESAKSYVEKINSYMKPKINSNWEYFDAYTNEEWKEQAAQSANLMTTIGAAVAGISLLVGGIGIMNIMLVSVTERTREIGIRMAIGARRRDIILQFVIEAAVISATGGLIGIAIGYICSSIGGTYFLKTLIMPSIPLTIGAFAFSVIMGLIFGIYPANKASKLQPVDALRTQ